MSEDQMPCQNNDKVLYREKNSDHVGAFDDSLFVTDQGGIGIDVAGSVYVKPLKGWHQLEAERDQLRSLLAKERDEFGAKETALMARIGELEQGTVSHQGGKILCPDCEAPCELKQRMGGEHYLAHPVYACPKGIQAELAEAVVENAGLEGRLVGLSKLAHRMAEGIEAKEDLLAVYRVPGRRPSEALFKKLAKADKALAAFRAAEGEGKHGDE